MILWQTSFPCLFTSCLLFIENPSLTSPGYHPDFHTRRLRLRLRPSDSFSWLFCSSLNLTRNARFNSAANISWQDFSWGTYSTGPSATPANSSGMKYFYRKNVVFPVRLFHWFSLHAFPVAAKEKNRFLSVNGIRIMRSTGTMVIKMITENFGKIQYIKSLMVR